MKNDIKYHDIEKMCLTVSTPFYAYSRNAIRDNYYLLRNSLDKDIGILYSIKTNPNHEIIELFDNLGSGVVCSCAAEIESAQCKNIPKKDILLISPGKTYEDLTCAVKCDIGMIVVDSIEEIEQIACITRCLNKSVNIGIRVNIDDTKIKAKEIFSAPHFGMPKTDIIDAINLIQENNMLIFKGFHCFIGTQILKSRIVCDCFKSYLMYISDAFNQIRDRSVKLRVLFSPGIGVDYYEEGKSVDINEMTDEINNLWKQFCMSHCQYSLCLDLILGRYLVATSGYYISRIIDEKDVYGKKFIITNGGTHQISPTFMLGKFLKSNLPVTIVGKETRELKEITITGKLLTPTDILAANIKAQNYSIDDFVIIPNTGAYCRSFSVLDFMSHKVPTEIFID